MSDRLTRKRIKQDIREDEVRSRLAGIFFYIQDHPRMLVGIAVGIVLLVLAGSGIASLLEGRAAGANERLADAIEIARAPIVDEDAQPEDPDDPSFASEEERRERSRAAFTEIHDSFGSSIAGDVAGLYLAEMAAADGDTAGARETWEEFLDDHPDHVLAMSVRVNLIHLDRQEGRAEDVATSLEQELDDGGDMSLPEDVLLFELAQTYDTLDRSEEARELYQRILDEHPASPYAGEAREHTTAADAA